MTTPTSRTRWSTTGHSWMPMSPQICISSAQVATASEYTLLECRKSTGRYWPPSGCGLSASFHRWLRATLPVAPQRACRHPCPARTRRLLPHNLRNPAGPTTRPQARSLIRTAGRTRTEDLSRKVFTLRRLPARPRPAVPYRRRLPTARPQRWPGSCRRRSPSCVPYPSARRCPG